MHEVCRASFSCSSSCEGSLQTPGVGELHMFSSPRYAYTTPSSTAIDYHSPFISYREDDIWITMLHRVFAEHAHTTQPRASQHMM